MQVISVVLLGQSDCCGRIAACGVRVEAVADVSFQVGPGEIFGLLGTNVPESFGGVDLDKVATLLVSEQLAFNASFAATFGAQANLVILPILMFGKGDGRLKPGRQIRFGKETPLCNLYLTMLHILGIEQRTFGDSRGLILNLTVG